MPAELTNLSEQLQNLQVVYQSAVASNKSIEDLVKLRIQIIEIQDKILEREKYLTTQKN